MRLRHQPAVEPHPTPPPLEPSPNDTFRKEHATKMPLSPGKGDLRLSPELMGGVEGRGIPSKPPIRETTPKGGVFGVAAAPARGFPRIQPRPTRSAQPTTESSGLSHQDPDLAKEEADRGGGDGLHQWHTCREGCTPATADRRHLVTREIEGASSSHRQGGPPPGPPHPHLPGPPPRIQHPPFQIRQSIVRLPPRPPLGTVRPPRRRAHGDHRGPDRRRCHRSGPHPRDRGSSASLALSERVMPPPPPQHRRKRPSAPLAARCTTSNKSIQGTSVKKAPPKLPYDMTGQENTDIVASEVTAHFARKRPPPMEKVDPVKMKRCLDAL